MIKRPASALAALALAAGVIAATAPGASAKGGGDIRTEGNCTRATDWKLKAKADNGRIELESEVDSNIVGQKWSVVLRDNGVLLHSGMHTTVAPSGSFGVDLLVANRAGTDTFTLRATNAATGEVCSGRLVFPG